MSDLKNFFRDLGYFGVGAAAVVVEAGGKVVGSLVRKGEKVLRDNQDTVDDLKRKAKEAGVRVKAAVDSFTAPMEETPEEPVVEEPVVDEPHAEEPSVEEPVAEEHVVPDVIYRTEEPAPAEDLPEAEPEEEPKPEETING